MNKYNKNINLILLTFEHLVVDFCSAYFVTKFILKFNINYNYKFMIICIYNFCAFFMQLPFGIILDKIKLLKNKQQIANKIANNSNYKNQISNQINNIFDCVKYNYLFIILSFAMIIFGCLIQKEFIFATMLIGFGNGLFHVGAGVDVYEKSNKNMSDIGIFVSSGALGLFFGISSKIVNKYIPIFISFILIIINYLYCKKIESKNKIFNIEASKNNYIIDNQNKKYFDSKKTIIISIVLFVCIIIRSYIGITSNFLYKKIYIINLLLVIATVLGKAMGGILVDNFQYFFKTKNISSVFISLFSLLFAILFFLLSSNFIFGVLFTILFNMLMPITLYYMFSLFKNNEGFAFSLTTAALFFGFIFNIFFNINDNTIFILFLIFIQMVLLVGALVYIIKSNLK